MADPLRKPFEPDFTVEPFAEPQLPAKTADVTELGAPNRDRKLVNTAESLGSTLGSTVSTIRDRVQSGMEVVRRRSAETSESMDDLTEMVRDRADQIKEQANRKIQEFGSAAQRRMRTIRARAQEFSRERPAELILAIGGVALVAGIILRLWRSNHD